jgi:hypothetical protein
MFTSVVVSIAIRNTRHPIKTLASKRAFMVLLLELRAPLRRIGQEYSAKVAFSIFQSMKRIQSLPVRSKLI